VDTSVDTSVDTLDKITGDALSKRSERTLSNIAELEKLFTRSVLFILFLDVCLFFVSFSVSFVFCIFRVSRYLPSIISIIILGSGMYQHGRNTVEVHIPTYSESLLEFSGVLWSSLEFSGVLWSSLEFSGVLWSSSFLRKEHACTSWYTLPCLNWSSVSFSALLGTGE
jgi:hypothetical protein